MSASVPVARVIRVAMITNVPAPYRLPGWRLLASSGDIRFDVVYFAPAHIDRTIETEGPGLGAHFLRGPYSAKDRSFMHADLGVWRALRRLDPDVVITTGFVPTYLYAFAWAHLNRVPHIAMTDGTFQSEQRLGPVHRFVRRRVFARTASFVAASAGARALYRSYGIPDTRIHRSVLSIDNARFDVEPGMPESDLIFCGRLLPLKRPQFALEVARGLAARLRRRIRLDFVGSGPLEGALRAQASNCTAEVDTRFHGYVAQDALPALYAASRVFLFPTDGDVWGVVANEACAAGLPVIVSPHAGAAGELVRDGDNGYVRELDLGAWIEAAAALLSDSGLHRRFAIRARALVAEYTPERAAEGLRAAILQASGRA